MQRNHKGNVLIVDNDDRILWAFQEHLERRASPPKPPGVAMRRWPCLDPASSTFCLWTITCLTFTPTIFSSGSAAYRTNLRLS